MFRAEVRGPKIVPGTLEVARLDDANKTVFLSPTLRLCVFPTAEATLYNPRYSLIRVRTPRINDTVLFMHDDRSGQEFTEIIRPEYDDFTLTDNLGQQVGFRIVPSDPSDDSHPYFNIVPHVQKSQGERLTAMGAYEYLTGRVFDDYNPEPYGANFLVYSLLQNGDETMRKPYTNEYIQLKGVQLPCALGFSWYDAYSVEHKAVVTVNDSDSELSSPDLKAEIPLLGM